MRKGLVTFVGTLTFLFLFTVTAFADSRFVTASVLNIRQEASTESNVIGKVVCGDELDLVEVTDANWAKVRIGERYGYVAREYLAVSREAAVVRLGSRSGKRPVSQGQSVVEYAKRFIGTPYVYGGSTPSGFDCSGFVKYVYSNFGVTLTRTSYSQVNEGSYVARADLQPGDLVFFGSAGNVHHVGIYVSDGNFIHAPKPGKTVRIETLNSGYYNNNYYTARRVR
ncbi:MAG: C40 family peptidase [Clostridia bacterium]|nr:C40 family peptidase [Clostridia bacterium]